MSWPNLQEPSCFHALRSKTRWDALGLLHTWWQVTHHAFLSSFALRSLLELAGTK